MDKQNKLLRRKVHIDLLRILAICLVIFNHTSSNGYMLFSTARTSPFYYLYMGMSVFAKNGVPIFFMISGALLLNKEESYKRLAGKFTRFLIILVVCSLITYIWSYKRYGYYDSISSVDFLKMLYTSDIATAYWYLYAYLGLILMLPCIRPMVKGMKDRDFIALIIIYVLLTINSMTDYIIWKGTAGRNSSFSLPIFVNVIFYPMMGYYLEHRINIKIIKACHIVLMLMAFIISIMISCFMTNYKCLYTGDWSEANCQSYMAAFALIQSGVIFIIAKYVTDKISFSPRFEEIIAELGACTFGVYLFERIWRHETYFIFQNVNRYMPTMISCIVWVITAVILGIIFAAIYRGIIRAFKNINDANTVL